mgnify:CR=1 FL=1
MRGSFPAMARYERLKVSRRSRPRSAQQWLVERLAEQPDAANR